MLKRITDENSLEGREIKKVFLLDDFFILIFDSEYFVAHSDSQYLGDSTVTNFISVSENFDPFNNECYKDDFIDIGLTTEEEWLKRELKAEEDYNKRELEQKREKYLAAKKTVGQLESLFKKS